VEKPDAIMAAWVLEIVQWFASLMPFT
jgi:hypothetical protein